MYKLIALDLDGTLTNSKKIITPLTFQALMDAQQKGIRIVLASGRPTYGIVPLAELLNIANYGGYIMAFNGGKVTDAATKTTDFEQRLNSDLIPLLYKEAMNADMNILTYQGENIIATSDTDEYVLEEHRINNMPVVNVGKDFLNHITESVNKCLIVGNPEKMEMLKQRITKESNNNICTYTSAPFFLECVPNGIDKAASLERLCTQLRIDRSEVMAFGDGHNDISMIRFAGLGVAMENADDIVKAAADVTTASNDKDGVAHILMQYYN